MGGWIKLHRKIIESSVFENPNVLKMWIWALSKASHSEHKQLVGMQEVELKKGEFVFGRKVAARELSMSESNSYRILKTLENMKLLSVKSNNKFSVVTIEKWGVYQSDKANPEQQMNNKRTTNEQQMNTNKNVKNVKNEKKKEYVPSRRPSPRGVAASVEENLDCTIANPIPKGMSVEEYERRKAEARL